MVNTEEGRNELKMLNKGTYIVYTAKVEVMCLSIRKWLALNLKKDAVMKNAEGNTHDVD